MNKDERRAEVIRRWQEQPENERTEDWIVRFYERHCSGLAGYTEVKRILASYLRHKPKTGGD